MKICTKCKIEKSLDEFYNNRRRKDGKTSHCKACASACDKTRYVANRDTRRKQHKAHYEANRDAIRERQKAARDADPEKFNARNRKDYEDNREARRARRKEYHEENREAIRERKKVYHRDHPEVFRANAAKRRAAKLERTPTWSNDSAEIKELHRQAVALEELTGIKFEIDHVYPLQGEHVSGLHVAGNLQILTEAENRQKSNNYEIR